MIFDAGHSFGGDHGVDDGFFGGLDSGTKNGIELVVGQHFQVNDMVGSSSARISRRKSDKNIAGAIAGNAAVAAEPKRNAPRGGLGLGAAWRTVRGHHDDI